MRQDNWQASLSELIENNRNKPFDFVNHNCLLWAGLAIKAVTKKDLLAHIKGKYDSEATALRYLKKEEKVNNVEEFLAKLLNKELLPIAFARLGDIVFADPYKNDDLQVDCGSKFGLVPGVCYGTISYFVGYDGLIKYETLKLDSALWVS